MKEPTQTIQEFIPLTGERFEEYEHPSFEGEDGCQYVAVPNGTTHIRCESYGVTCGKIADSINKNFLSEKEAYDKKKAEYDITLNEYNAYQSALLESEAKRKQEEKPRRIEEYQRLSAQPFAHLSGWDKFKLSEYLNDESISGLDRRKYKTSW